MENYIFPSSPSWYCSRVSDCNEEGVLAFGAKNSVFLLNITSNPPTNQGYFRAHNDRLVSLSLSHHIGHRHLCCTTGEDKCVKVWDLKSLKLVEEHSFHKYSPTAIHWSPTKEQQIVSSDEKGTVIVWHRGSKTFDQFTPEKNHIFSLTCSPHHQDHIAIGYKTGLVLLIDTSKKGSIIQRFRGHDEEIHCISWCPILGNVSQLDNSTGDKSDQANGETTDTLKDDCLIATASRDRTIRIWSCDKGKSNFIWKLPSGGNKREKYEDHGKTRAWVTLSWCKTRPNEIISSGQGGELLCWDLLKTGKQKWKSFTNGDAGNGHQRIVFNICAGGQDLDTLCTISMDRQIGIWSSSLLSGKYMLPSIGGYVYSLVQSSVDPSRLAIGAGDNLIRLWNLTNPNNPYETQTLWQGIRAKVTCLCWHPTKEGILAYGTDDGRVGIYDVLTTKPPCISSTYHKRMVYVVSWGPDSLESSKVQYVLYSCGDGVILKHDPSHLDGDAVDMNGIIEKTNGSKKFPIRSEISWKPDFSVVAIGNDDGSIEIFKAPDWKLVCVVHVHRKLVNCVRWHPQYTTESSDASACQFWLASGSNEHNVHVVDLQKMLGGEVAADKVVISESMCALQGHTNRIVGLTWSQHTDGRLASASFDGTAQVWDVKSGEPVANFRGHSGKLFSIQWSAQSADLIFTGAEDNCVFPWYVSKQPHKVPPSATDKKNKRKNKGKGKNKVNKDTPKEPFEAQVCGLGGASGGGDDVSFLTEMLEKKKKDLEIKLQGEPGLNLEGSGEILTDDNIRDEHSYIKDKLTTILGNLSPQKEDSPLPVQEDQNLKQEPKRKRKSKSLFPVSSSKENRGRSSGHEDCISFVKFMESEEKCLPENLSHFGLLTDRKNAYELLRNEADHHTGQGNTDQLLILEVMKGNIGKAVDMATQGGYLNDWIVSLAPMASLTVWRKTCESYAKQLEKDGIIQKAALYYVHCGKLYEGIELLQANNMFRDALCLATTRLSPMDPLLKDLYVSWAHQCTMDGNLEQAAKCYIAIKEPLEAAKVLVKKGDPLAYKTAVEITYMCNQMMPCKSYAQKLVYECQLKWDWLTVTEVINDKKSLQAFLPSITLHEALVKELVNIGVFEIMTADEIRYTEPKARCTAPLPRLLLDPNGKDPVCLWPPHTVQGEAFVTDILRKWFELWGLDLNSSDLARMYQELVGIAHTKQNQIGAKQIVVDISLKITLGILQLLLGETGVAMEWWVGAMETCYNTEHFDILHGICKLLLPIGPHYIIKLQHEVTALRLTAMASSFQNTERKVPQRSARGSIKEEDFNASQRATYNAIKAFFYWSVLQQTNVKKSESAKGIDIRSGENIENDQYDDNTNDKLNQNSKESVSNSETGVGLDYGKVLLTCNNLETLMKCLLDENQTKQCMLVDSLQCIHQSVATLVQKHHKSNQNKSENEEEPLDVTCKKNLDQLPLPKLALERTVSGEYVNMSGRSNTEAQDIVRQLSSPDAYETMYPESAECSSQCMEPKYIKETDCIKKEPAELKDTSKLEKQDDNDLECNNVNNESSRTDIFKKQNLYDIVADNSQGDQRPKGVFPKYDGVPDAWYSLPVDIKYQQECVTLSMLTLEQKRVQKELSELHKKTMNLPFPHPVQTASLLHGLLKNHSLCQETKSYVTTIVDWGNTNAYTTAQKKMFE